MITKYNIWIAQIMYLFNFKQKPYTLNDYVVASGYLWMLNVNDTVGQTNYSAWMRFHERTNQQTNNDSNLPLILWPSPKNLNRHWHCKLLLLPPYQNNNSIICFIVISHQPILWLTNHPPTIRPTNWWPKLLLLIDVNYTFELVSEQFITKYMHRWIV